MLSLALGRVGIRPHDFWLLTFTELSYVIDNYYHRQDQQTEQTREIIAMIYNANRTKGPEKEGKDFMSTLAEIDKNESKEIELPNEDLKQKISKRYGG